MRTIKNKKKPNIVKRALDCAKKGCSVFPVFGVKNGVCLCKRGTACTRAGKHPMTKHGVDDATTDIKRIKKWWRLYPSANIGIRTGIVSGFDVLDVDGKKGRTSLQKLTAKHGALPKTVRVKTPRGEHIYFRHPGGKIKNLVGVLPGLDVRGDGGYVVGAGSKSASGKIYSYKPGRALEQVKLAKVPGWLLALIRPPKAALLGDRSPPCLSTVSKAYGARALELEAARVVNAPNHRRNDTLNTAAFKLGQLAAHGALSETQVRQTLSRAALTAGLEEQEIPGTIKSGFSAGLKCPRKFLAGALPDRDLSRRLSKLGRTDADNAERFVARYGGQVVWTCGLAWLVFDGRRWVVDGHNMRVKLAVSAMKAIKEEAPHLTGKKRGNRLKFRRYSLSKQALDKMLATAQPDLAVDDAKLDSDLNLLNVQNGTLDLKTGVLHPHNPTDLITKLCPVNFNPKAKCPQFIAFLRKVTGGNKDMMRFLRKAAGYSLTGECTEQVLFFLYGPTRTGKSTLINLLRDLVGDYGINTPTKTLLVKHYDNDIPVDLARMKGARVVTASENNPNQQLDEAKVKSMTGGDKQTARFMRQNPFDFQPEFKLWIAANDLPRVRATDDAIWNRFIVLGFNNQVEEDRDEDLPKKLRTELEGILAWAVRGALLWRKERLVDRIMFETEKDRWRMQSDTVGRFFHECCETVAPTETVQSSILYARYERWCKANAEKPATPSLFKTGLNQLNVAWKKTNKNAVFLGIKVIK